MFAAMLAAVILAPAPTIEEFLKDKGAEARPGLVKSYLAAKSGEVYLELPAPNAKGVVGEYLLNTGIRTGLGSNDVGLDRGLLTGEHVVTIRRVADRILFEKPNLDYRALSADEQERAAVRESFATSILWTAKVAAEEADGRTLINFTPYVLEDRAGLSESLAGGARLDASRSVLQPEECFAFPKNLEFEAILTFAVGAPSSFIRETSPDPESVTMVQHISLIELPEPGYSPREYDPRIGMFSTTFMDYSAPLGRPLRRQWVLRHRLEKTNPNAARSTVKEPIVYYLDSGVPEPIRTALLDGAKWWGDAFDQAGFIDAFQVKMLPKGANPMDVRYNVIQWVHRATRGWSYGSSVSDPRTGEIIKGHVTLGSLRVRQDITIFEGLFGAEKTGKGGPNDPITLSLARLRQLSAHEIGHTLGFSHNFAASSYGRGSVMDYPSPWIKATAQGQLDGSQAYKEGIGEWDVHAVKWGYGEFPAANEAAELDKIVRDGIAKGYVFSTDQDARAPGASDPRSTLWDNGSDPVEELENVLRVRKIALDRFGAQNLAAGQPIALLHEVFVPIYLYHRYQAEAAAHVLGGLAYDSKLNGDPLPLPRTIPAAQQQRALDALLKCLEPETLNIRPEVLDLLSPRPAGYGSNRELFKGQTDPAFDQISAAQTGAETVLVFLLDKTRLARMDSQNDRNAALPGSGFVMDGLVRTLARPSLSAVQVQNAVRQSAARSLMRLESGDAPLTVRANARMALKQLSDAFRKEELTGRKPVSGYLADEIERFLKRPAGEPFPIPAAPAIPPGSPIGFDCACGA